MKRLVRVRALRRCLFAAGTVAAGREHVSVQRRKGCGPIRVGPAVNVEALPGDGFAMGEALVVGADAASMRVVGRIPAPSADTGERNGARAAVRSAE